MYTRTHAHTHTHAHTNTRTWGTSTDERAISNIAPVAAICGWSAPLLSKLLQARRSKVRARGPEAGRREGSGH
eukprot:4165417-Alexandrium_andersonii.AAC.1